MNIPSAPLSRINYGSVIVDHVRSQPVKRWCTFTLEYPRWTHQKLWDIALRRTFVELEHRILRRKLMRENLATGATAIRRVVTIGGNLDDENKVKKAYHAQGLIDGIADDKFLRYELAKAWKNNVRRIVEKQGHRFHDREAQVYFAELNGGLEFHIYYLLRLECKSIGAGIDKILRTESGISYLTDTFSLPKAA
jgi:hypothetical protein